MSERAANKPRQQQTNKLTDRPTQGRDRTDRRHLLLAPVRCARDSLHDCCARSHLYLEAAAVAKWESAPDGSSHNGPTEFQTPTRPAGGLCGCEQVGTDVE